jgi:uncharacterized protein (DUF2345 family)
VSQRPDLVLSAAGDIASLTPANAVLMAGQHTTVTAGQDTNLLAQRHQAWAVKDGISLFTRGEAKDGQHGVQEVGMKLHAASGNVSVQAQGDAFTLTAEKAVDVQSTAAIVLISAPSKILLNGGGSYIKIEGGDIEIGTSGQASFKAGMKELTGGGSASTPGMSFAQSALTTPKRALQLTLVNAEGDLPSSEPMKIIDGAGVEHAVTVSSGAAHIAEFKPGFARSSQPKRKT